MLDVFSGPDLPGRVYGMLVRQPRATEADIAEALGLDTGEVADVLALLAQDGLALRVGGESAGGAPEGWEAQPPHDAVDVLLSEQERRLSAIRAEGRKLSELYWLARSDRRRYPGIEVVRGHAVVVERYLQMQANATSSMRVFDCPPYYSEADDELVRQQTALQTERMAAGIEYRTVYADSAFEHPQFSRVALALIGRGEQARTLPALPLKLVICDDSRAMLPLDPMDAHDGASLVVHRSGLLTALVSIFETMWNMAVPVSARPGNDALGEADRAILTLMASGATDETIARRLGLSRRTVVRRAGVLMERLGASTRFQAGVQAARLGWL